MELRIKIIFILIVSIFSRSESLCTLTPRELCSNSCGSGHQNMSLVCDDWKGEYRFTAYCSSSTGCTGGWSDWTTFGQCSKTCDEGHQLVKRRCDNPLPGRYAPYCDGEDVKYVNCNLRGCPGSWSCWEDDGHCSTSCGNGTQIKRRLCDNPAPTNGGQTCPGENLTNVHCHIKECPVYKWGHLKELNLTQNDLKEIMEDEMKEMKNNLTIDSKNISASIRKRISANDNRLSAASVGYVGVALLLIPLVMIIFVDASRVFVVVATIYKTVCSRKSAQF